MTTDRALVGQRYRTLLVLRGSIRRFKCLERPVVMLVELWSDDARLDRLRLRLDESHAAAPRDCCVTRCGTPLRQDAVVMAVATCGRVGL